MSAILRGVNNLTGDYSKMGLSLLQSHLPSSGLTRPAVDFLGLSVTTTLLAAVVLVLVILLLGCTPNNPIPPLLSSRKGKPHKHTVSLLRRKLEAIIGGKLLQILGRKSLMDAEMIPKQVILPSTGLPVYYYEREGTGGPTLLLCHGFTEKHSALGGGLEKGIAHVAVFAPRSTRTRKGFATSPATGNCELSLSQASRFVAEFDRVSPGTPS
jgi:hypothetical protein